MKNDRYMLEAQIHLSDPPVNPYDFILRFSLDASKNKI
jgi:hypothetical protein